jgi:hypothetical protein
MIQRPVSGTIDTMLQSSFSVRATCASCSLQSRCMKIDPSTRSKLFSTQRRIRPDGRFRDPSGSSILRCPQGKSVRRDVGVTASATSVAITGRHPHGWRWISSAGLNEVAYRCRRFSCRYICNPSVLSPRWQRAFRGVSWREQGKALGIRVA